MQKASFQAARAFYTAQSYLAADKPAEAAALFERASQRVTQAEAAWDDLERPDAAALAALSALSAQAQVCVRAHCCPAAATVPDQRMTEEILHDTSRKCILP